MSSQQLLREATGIHIRIQAGATLAESSIAVSGSTKHVVTEDERKRMFKIKTDALKYAVHKHLGKKPDDLFVRGPTPWNDLYSTHQWDEVHVVWVPTHAKILSVSSSSRPNTVTTCEFENNTTEAGPISNQVSASEPTTATSTWYSKNKKVASDGEGQENINYEIQVLGAGVNGETAVRFVQGPTKSPATHQERITVGLPKTPVDVQLQPGETATAHLKASPCVLKAKITYKVFLAGTLATNYLKSYRGQHFWAVDIQTALSQAGIKNNIVVHETVDIGYPSAAHICLDGNCHEGNLPVSALTVGRPLLNNEPIPKRRVRSLETLQKIAGERGSGSGAPRQSLMFFGSRRIQSPSN